MSARGQNFFFGLLYAFGMMTDAMTSGKFTPCPNKPNCVSTQANPKSRHYLAPTPFEGSVSEVMEKVLELVKEIPRHTVRTKSDKYLHAEVKSRVFGFVDDLEIYLDESEKLVHMRSAARTGYGDLGVNRKRLEHLQRELKKSL